MVALYRHSFATRPNLTLAFTGASLNSLGDAIAQFTDNALGAAKHDDLPRYDGPRTLRFFLFGFIISPLLGRWNNALECWFPLQPYFRSKNVNFQALSKRVACDQLLLAPTGLAVFFGSMGVMERRSLAQIKAKYSDLYWPALLTNWKVWPLAQLVNFRYMPLPYRVPFQSGCGVFWTLYLSLMNAREDRLQDEEAELQRVTHIHEN